MSRTIRHTHQHDTNYGSVCKAAKRKARRAEDRKAVNEQLEG